MLKFLARTICFVALTLAVENVLAFGYNYLIRPSAPHSLATGLFIAELVAFACLWNVMVLRSAPVFRLAIPASRLWMAVGALCGSGLWLAGYLVLMWQRSLSPAQTLRMGASVDPGQLFIVLAGVLREELYYRHFLITAIVTSLAKSRLAVVKVLLAVVVQALFFEVMHEGHIRGEVFLLGLVFGALYCASNSIWPSLLAHSAFNVCSAVFFSSNFARLYPPRDFTQFQIGTSIAAALCTLWLLGMSLRKARPPTESPVENPFASDAISIGGPS